VALAYLTAFTLDGLSLVLALAAQAAALGELARRTSDRVARAVSLGFLGLAGAHVLVFEAPPTALVYGVGELAVAAVALAAVAGVAVRIARTWGRGSEVLNGLGGALVLYLGSVAIVSAFQPGPGALDAGLDFGVRQQGQAILSACWSVCGLGLLWAGLRGRSRELRLAGFGLLSLAVAKVFLFDLSVLQSEYRVLSLVVLGLLLLAGALAYQRMIRRGLDDGAPDQALAGRDSG
jgi:uncharacterized membrane protein